MTNNYHLLKSEIQICSINSPVDQLTRENPCIVDEMRKCEDDT